MGIETAKAKPRSNSHTNDDQARLDHHHRPAIASRQSLGLQNGDCHSREPNAHATNDPSSNHLAIRERRRLDGSANDDKNIGINDAPLASNLFAEDKRRDGAESAADIVDGCNKSSKRRRATDTMVSSVSGVQYGRCLYLRITQHLLESLAGQDASKQALVISEKQEVQARDGQDHSDQGLAP